MSAGSIGQHIGKWLAIAALLGFGLAMAQSKPRPGRLANNNGYEPLWPATPTWVATGTVN